MTSEERETTEVGTLRYDNDVDAQGYIIFYRSILFATNLSRDAKILWCFLESYARDKGQCWPGYETLRERMACSENVARNAMKELVAANLVAVKRRGQGMSNIYTLVDVRTSKLKGQDHQKTTGQTLQSRGSSASYSAAPDPQKTGYEVVPNEVVPNEVLSNEGDDVHPAVRRTAQLFGMTAAAYPWIADLQAKLEASGRATDIYQEAIACKGWCEATLPPEKHIWSIRLPNWITSTIEKGPTPAGRRGEPDPELPPAEEVGIPIFDRLREAFRTTPGFTAGAWHDMLELWARPGRTPGEVIITYPWTEEWFTHQMMPGIETMLAALGFTGNVVFEHRPSTEDTP